MLNPAVILRESARARPTAAALLHDGGTELDARSDAVAASLTARGVQPGDRLQVPATGRVPR
jgi:long-chain acyl-CoA synthetase